MSKDYYELDELGYINDAFGAYLRYLKGLPPLPKEEIYALGKEVQKGNKEAQEKLILHHLAYVVYVAKPLFKKYPNIDPMDIVQYGNEGLIKAVSMYDPDSGTLTTYAHDWILQKITRYIGTDYSDIKTPEHVIVAIKKYKSILAKASYEGCEIPKDDELCKILNVSVETLEAIKNTVHTSVVSMNEKLDDDGDDELENFIEDNNAKSSEDVIKSIDNFELLIALKSILSMRQYYVLYMRIFDTRVHSLDELARELGVTKERIRQIEDKAKKKIEPLLSNNYKNIPNIIRSIKLKEKSKFFKLNERPLQPKELLKYLYLVVFFSGIEKDLIKDIFLHPYKETLKAIASRYSITEREFVALFNKVKIRIKNILEKNHEDFESFKNDMINTYGSSIYDINLERDYKDIDYQDIIKRYSALTFDDILKLYGNMFYKLPKDSQRLLDRYFKRPNKAIADEKFIEKEVNLSKHGCKNQNIDLPPSTLYMTYLKFKDNFSSEQQLVLECYFFNKKDKSLYDNVEHSISRATILSNAKFKLEKFYFNLHKVFLYQTLTKEIYESVLESYPDALSGDRKRFLNAYFGIGTERMSLQEIVDKHNLDYIKTHSFFKATREYVFRLYTNRTSKNVFDKDIYFKYITNVAYELTPETRKMLRMHVIEGKTYDEIQKETGVGNRRISNIIGDGIRKLDNYRFGIKKATIVTNDMLNTFLMNTTASFDEFELFIVRRRYIDHLNTEDILNLLKRKEKDGTLPYGTNKANINKNFINNTNRKFLSAYNHFLVSSIELTDEYINDAINKRPLESILSYDEKMVVSMFFGIKSEFNLDGKSYNPNEIISTMNLSKDRYIHLKNNAVKKLKMNMVGLIDIPDIYMPLDKLEGILLDVHTPISDKERMIINSFCALNGEEKKSFKELGSIYGDTEASIKRRYERAMIGIFKYLNGEIEAKIDFDADIVPMLKYFSKIDRMYIIDYYQNNLSYETIAKKYSISFDKIVEIFNAIKIRIDEILKNPNEKRFDYEYADTVLDEEELPFYGNRDVAKKLYKYCFCGDSMEKVAISTAVENLNLDMTSQKASTVLSSYMLAICKFREGIRLKNHFSHEQIVDYYNRNKDNINKQKETSYNFYFSKYNRHGSLSVNHVNETIKNDLLKDSVDDYFRLNAASRDEVIEILKNKEYRLDKRIRQALMYRFNIGEREFMNGQEINHVLRLINLLDLHLNADKASNLENSFQIKTLK